MWHDFKGITFGILTTPIFFVKSKTIASAISKIYTNANGKEIKIVTDTEIKLFRKRQFQTFMTIATLFVFALITTYIHPNEHFLASRYLEISSIFLLAQAVFGFLDCTTWGGESYLEKLNLWWFRSLYMLGVFLLFLSLMN